MAAVRVLHLLRMAARHAPLRRILRLLYAAILRFTAIFFLILITLLIYTLVGLHTFGGLRQQLLAFPNYDTFFNALIASFECLTLEDWCGRRRGD